MKFKISKLILMIFSGFLILSIFMSVIFMICTYGSDVETDISNQLTEERLVDY